MRPAFTHDFGLVRNLAQGAFNYTGNIFDLAVQGEGYFATQTGDGQTRYEAAIGRHHHDHHRR